MAQTQSNDQTRQTAKTIVKGAQKNRPSDQSATESTQRTHRPYVSGTPAGRTDEICLQRPSVQS